jgi:predicted ATP-dependent endonuclease of OLD family
MRLESIRIRNYRSFLDSGVLSFSAGFNLVVGANNVGKSSLLASLAAKFGGEPHRSLHILPTRDETVNPMSRVDFQIVASGEEIRRLSARETVIGIFHGPRSCHSTEMHRLSP